MAIVAGAAVGFYVTAIGSVWLGIQLMPWLTVALVMGFLIWFFRWMRGQQKLARRFDACVGKLDAGRITDAASDVDRLILDSRFAPGVETLAIAIRAMVFIREGDFERARKMLTDVHGSGWFKYEGLLPSRGRVEVANAMIDALTGNFESANEWATKAKKTILPGREGMLLPIATVISVRQGRFDEALIRMEAEWLDAEGGLTAHDGRVLRVMRAFAIASKRPDDVDGLRIAVESVKPFREGEFDYLATSWPELKSFLTAHGLMKGEAAIAAASDTVGELASGA